MEQAENLWNLIRPLLINVVQWLFEHVRFVLIGLLLILGGCQTTTEPTPAPSTVAEVSPYLTDYLKKYNLTGLSATLFRGEQVLWSQGVGLAQKTPNRPATEQTVFLTASFAKTITALAVMQLAEQNKLNLDEDINRYLDFKLTNPKRPASPITCRQLMTHTSGIVDDHYNELVQKDPLQFYFDQTDPPLSLQAICRAFLTPTGPYYSPGSFSEKAGNGVASYNYGNVATTLLAYVVERASGQPFAQYTQKAIFAPLGMSRTSWQIRSFTADDMAYQYKGDGTLYGNYTLALWPAGGLRSTASDLSLLLRAVAMGGSLNGKRILSAQSTEAMLTPQFELGEGLSLALIWAKAELGSYKNLRGYIGQGEGVNSQMFYDPVSQVGVIVLVNQDFAKPQEAATLLTVVTDLLTIARQAP